MFVEGEILPSLANVSVSGSFSDVIYHLVMLETLSSTLIELYSPVIIPNTSIDL